MQLEKKTKTHKIFKRNDGRYAVKTSKGKPVNGDDKIAILLAEGLVTAPEPKAEPEPEPTEAAEEATEAAAADAPEAEEDAPAEEAPAEEATEEAPAEEEAAADAEAKEDKKD